jgi:hypothetical protein
LTLGNIIDEERITKLQKIQKLQSPIDEAQNKLNQAILLRRSFDMTRQELINLNVDTQDIDKQLKGVNKAIVDAAKDYTKEAVQGLPKVATARKGLEKITKDYESPIDYVRSQLKDIPLAADSIRMNAQYFSFNQNSQHDNSQMAALRAFVSAETSSLGDKFSAEATTEAQKQTNSQRENHTLDGTLVITANCTHKMASLWAPLIIDVDKAIRVWNRMKLKPMIKPGDVSSMKDIEAKAESEKEDYFSILSGVTRGSSFVGMVHVLKQSSTETTQKMYAAAASLQAQMSVGSWFKSASGGFGVSSSFANSAKTLLSQQNISSHVSMVCMGVIPTIAANDVQLAVKQFSNFSPDETMGKLAVLQNATADGQASVQAGAQAARTGQSMVSLESARIQSVMSAVSEHQEGTNKILDINSLMQAFTDFVDKAAAGESGVPINYYLKPITAKQLAQMWVAKYLPGQYITSAGDDQDK